MENCIKKLLILYWKSLILVQELRNYNKITVRTNGMSTQLFGEYKNIMNAINIEIESSFKENKSIVYSMKFINADLLETPQF